MPLSPAQFKGQLAPPASWGQPIGPIHCASQPAHLLLVPALMRRHLGQERGGAAPTGGWVHKLDDKACR